MPSIQHPTCGDYICIPMLNITLIDPSPHFPKMQNIYDRIANEQNLKSHLSNQFGVLGICDVILADIPMEPVAEVHVPIIQRYQDVRDKAWGKECEPY